MRAAAEPIPILLLLRTRGEKKKRCFMCFFLGGSDTQINASFLHGRCLRRDGGRRGRTGGKRLQHIYRIFPPFFLFLLRRCCCRNNGRRP